MEYLHRLADETNAVYDLYVHYDYSVKKIGRELNMSPGTVLNRLKIARVKTRNPGAQPGDRNNQFPGHRDMDATVFLYRSGMTMKQVADEVGLKSHSAVQARLAAAGVKPRDKSESQRLRWAIQKQQRRSKGVAK